MFGSNPFGVGNRPSGPIDGTGEYKHRNFIAAGHRISRTSGSNRNA